MHSGGVSIWLCVGTMLLVYGAMVLGYSAYEWSTGSYPAGVQLTALHTPVWWGVLLSALGLFYVVRFRPGKAGN